MRRILAAAGLSLLAAGGASAQTLAGDEVMSSVAVHPLGTPSPVQGTDNRVHLAHELMIANLSPFFVTLDRLEAVDQTGAVVGSLEGDALAAMVESWSGDGSRLAPGGGLVALLDISFGPGETLPETLAGRITITRQFRGPDGRPAPLPPEVPLPATATFDAAATPLGPPAVIVAPPLRGPGWVVVNGCCDSVTSHRGAIIPVNGTPRVPERYAIDFVQLDAEGRLFTGDGKAIEDYAYYGTPIHAAADGAVVNLYDEADEQVPLGQVSGITPESIGGNMLVVDIGGGNYAFYAHLQRGSLKVGLGDRVRAGDEIALLGNTGNTTAPHLHFHVMDGTSPLDADGVPYVFTQFTGRGVLAGGTDGVLDGKIGEIDASRLAGSFEGALPLNDQVVDFD